jgi:hypothetical protein
MPESAFLICRFWLIDAPWWLGRREEARDLALIGAACDPFFIRCAPSKP